MARLKTIGLWIVTLLMAVVMIGPGSQKFTSPTWERMFRSWGYPDNFYLVVGAVEVVAGIGLLIPRFASASGIILAVVMVCAGLTQLTVGGRSGVGEFVFAMLMCLIAYARWPGVLAGLFRRAPQSRALTMP